ncbi:4'-phosphopantetheinyl transferase superfamily protein [Catellatospora sp. KI3]|uniref:4'-phosphopantetheinyl transferase family protein n=1 Tax=Catellatospora sp. KI3 TaxID=3041620 RepID=UPI002482D4DC|nr:4'-phosphopantetheinyl transferase superfamily protein [Catellatospora sp. KI3]MDI1463055.1 4'-phosphopantetheinyl transferase superfamily protein [Catellatospora sp. KI3]
MIEQVLPSAVRVAAVFADPEHAPDVLFPQEQAQIAKAVDKRRREFTTVRVCARAALAELGFAPAPLLPGVRGAPTWPAGVVGSLTHCDGYRAAAVARAADFASVGIDAEPHDALPEGVLGMITSESERRHLDGLARTAPQVHWDRLLFCAKEAVYKTWSPLTGGRWLDFLEADVALDPRAGTFRARLLVPGDCPDGRVLTGFDGRWHVADGLVVAGITVAP